MEKRGLNSPHFLKAHVVKKDLNFPPFSGGQRGKKVGLNFPHFLEVRVVKKRFEFPAFSEGPPVW